MIALPGHQFINISQIITGSRVTRACQRHRACCIVASVFGWGCHLRCLPAQTTIQQRFGSSSNSNKHSNNSNSGSTRLRIIATVALCGKLISAFIVFRALHISPHRQPHRACLSVCPTVQASQAAGKSMTLIDTGLLDNNGVVIAF